MDFSPTTEDQYATLQDLAKFVTMAGQTADAGEDEPSAEQKKLGEAAQAVLDDLAGTLWTSAAATNALAMKGVKGPHPGTFVYGKVIMTQREVVTFRKRNVIVFELEGADSLVAMPTTADTSNFRGGTRWLIMGLHDPTITLNIGFHDGPSKRAYIVEGKYVVGEPRRR